jgi:hypothetical protein
LEDNRRIVDTLTRESERIRDIKRILKVGQFLGIDLSQENPDKWSTFCYNLLHEYEEEHGIGTSLFLGDILIQGGSSRHLTEAERNSDEYAELKVWVINKYDELSKRKREDE